MTPEESLMQTLKASTELTALVGTRIFVDRAEASSARPFIVFAKEGTQNLRSFDGTVLNPDVNFLIHAWCDTRKMAEQIGDIIDSALEMEGLYSNDRSGGFSDELGLHSCELKVIWS